MAFPYTNIQTFIRHCIEPHVVSLKTILRLGFKQSRIDLDTEIATLKAMIDDRLTGIFVGDIRLLPFRASDLATHCPGWYFCDGHNYALTSPVGLKLDALPANFKSDWGIEVSGNTINLPNLFHSDGRGYFLRPVNGTVRQTGSVQLDAFQEHTHVVGELGYEQYTAQTVQQLRANSNGNVVSSKPSGRTDTETRGLNIGMTPAIFLGV